MKIFPESRWNELATVLANQKGISIILGTIDSGKSTLAHYLIGELLSRKITTALVDADIGQSSLGIPGTIGMKVFRAREDLKSMTAEKMAFIGTLNPATKIAGMIKHTGRMVDISIQNNARTVIVDTTGLIDGSIGKDIKIGKIRAIRPNHIIAIQREDELEHILKSSKEVNILRLKPSKFVKRRSREARIMYRHRMFSRHFRSSRILKLSFSEFDCVCNEKPINIRNTAVDNGTLLGLNHGEETIDVGIIEGISEETVHIKTPLQSKQTINRIVIGDIII